MHTWKLIQAGICTFVVMDEYVRLHQTSVVYCFETPFNSDLQVCTNSKFDAARAVLMLMMMQIRVITYKAASA